MSLERLLARVPGVYEDLVDAALPARGGEPSDRSPDPREKPAPGNLSVMELRHKLVRGLRWWVDAVDDGTEGGGPVGESVARMAAYLLHHSPVMAPEDKAELQANLTDWLTEAWEFMGAPDPVHVDLPDAAYEQRVRVADAARILGCTVRTIQRRVPTERRPGGMVSLADAVGRCGQCDLPNGTCEHTRSVTVVVAQ